MQGLKAAVLLASVMLPVVAQGQIFKCVDDSEHVTYQDRPCPTESVHAPMGQVAMSGMDSAAVQQAGRAARLQELQRQQTVLERRAEQRLRQLQSPASSSSSYQERLEERNANVQARARGIVPTGSNVRDAERMMGRPDSRRAFSASGQNCERLIWRDRDNRMTGHATACDGKIVHFSNSGN